MDQLKSFPVFRDDVQIGHICARARFLDESPTRTLRTLDGQEIQVPAELLEVRDDGTFVLLRPEALLLRPEASLLQQEALPQREEASFAAHVGGGAAHPMDAPQAWAAASAAPESDGRGAKTAEETFFESGYDVETVRVDQILDGPARERREGDVLILPVVEEVRVMEKKMLLRDEIRITPHKRPVTETRTILKP